MVNSGKNVTGPIRGPDHDAARSFLQEGSNGLVHPSRFFLFGELVFDYYGTNLAPDLVRPPGYGLDERPVRVRDQTFLGFDGLLEPLGEVGFDEPTPPHRLAFSLCHHPASVLPLLGLPVDGLVGSESGPPDAEGTDDPGHKHLARLCDDNALIPCKGAPQFTKILKVGWEGLDSLVWISFVSGEHKSQEHFSVEPTALQYFAQQTCVEEVDLVFGELVQTYKKFPMSTLLNFR